MMMPQINYRVISRAHARIKELAGAAAASTLLSILTAAVSPRTTEAWKSHLLFIVASGVLALILPSFTSRIVWLDAGLVLVFCFFEPIGGLLLHHEALPHYFIFALVLVLTVGYLLRSNGSPRAQYRGGS
jgi:4-hydroxybenzoate polyprenyltransferase